LNRAAFSLGYGCGGVVQVLPTTLTLWVGGGQPKQAQARTTSNTLGATVAIVGSAAPLASC